jgi:holo-[acyl-carrier protein] synthase
MELHSLAARFAAKEAFGKALGTGLAGFSLNECAVINDENGKPELFLFGKAKKAFQAFGGVRVLVALTHEHDYAIAVVVIEGSTEDSHG